MATPALRAIRGRFADARITFLMEPNLADLIRGGDWMDDCVEWPPRPRRGIWSRPFRRMIRRLRRRFDWAVLLPNSFSAALVARLTGARRRWGYDRDGRGFLLTDRVPVRNRRRGNSTVASTTAAAIPDRSRKRFTPMRLVDYYADLAEALGCPRPAERLELFTTPDCDASVDSRLNASGLDARRPLVVLCPGAKYGAAKCWPPDRFAAAADRLIDAHAAAVVVTCGPGEESIARAIASAMRHRALVADDPRFTLGELKSLIQRSRLLLCNDAGPRHFAKAFNVPVVTVFGPTHPEWTATRYPRERIVRIDVECGPCQERRCPLGHLQCMNGVTVDSVVAAATELLLESEADSTPLRE
jgi:heptosyltransferase-2